MFELLRLGKGCLKLYPSNERKLAFSVQLIFLVLNLKWLKQHLDASSYVLTVENLQFIHSKRWTITVREIYECQHKIIHWNNWVKDGQCWKISFTQKTWIIKMLPWDTTKPQTYFYATVLAFFTFVNLSILKQYNCKTL